MAAESNSEPPVLEEQVAASPTKDSKKKSELININKAQLEALEKLPGVGKVLAQRIIDHRTSKPFENLYQLRAVQGLGTEKLKGIAPCITGFVKPKKAPKEKKTRQRSNTNEAKKRGKDNKFMLASWNLRNLSKNRSADRIDKVLDIFKKFDMVAMQEIRDTQVLEIMADKLGSAWTYAVSDFVGTSAHKERYAFFWRTNRVKKLSEPKLLNDIQNDFVREPFSGYFKAGEFDFTLTTIHVVWGASIHGRREEIKKLDNVLGAIAKRSGPEKDLILCGDFNMPPEDLSWEIDGWQPLIRAPQKTLVGDTSLYDNIWISTENTSKSEFTGQAGVVCFDKELYEDSMSGRRKAICEVSDHRPVWGCFWSNVDDDDDVDIDLEDLKIE